MRDNDSDEKESDTFDPELTDSTDEKIRSRKKKRQDYYLPVLKYYKTQFELVFIVVFLK